jgi:hypothetical protein
MLKKTMMAMAGVTAGLSTALAGTGAQAAEPVAPTIDYPLPEIAGDVGPLAVCQEATQYNNGSLHFFIPSITRNGANLGCTLAQGNRTNGVFKLQDALRLCHGQSAVQSDGIFGPITAGGLANVTGGTVYTGNYRQINWPIFNANNQFTGVCANV